MEFLAKSDGTTLKDHSIEIVKQVEEILVNAGIENEVIINIAKVCALVHDIGKTAHFFQENINNQDELKNYPRHNEIGFALLSILIDKNYGFYNDNNWIDVIRYTTLYHHTPFNKPSQLSEYFNDTQLNEISDYFNNLFADYKVSDIIKFKKDVNIDDNDKIIGNIKTFDFIRIDESIKSNLNEYKLKYFEIIFNAVRYADLIVSGNYQYNENRPTTNITYIDLVKPKHFEGTRWDEQYEIANNAFAKNMAIIDATMGWGKTICGIMYLLHSNRKGFWVCPDNTLAQATYKNILNDLNEIGISDIKVSLVIGGSWENVSIKDADIVVTNIDSYVNGIFRNSRKTLSYEALFSNSIFDEFHEYAYSNSPILVRFMTIIEARKLMNNIKTLLLSGTVINDGFVNIKNVFIADKTELDKKRKMNITFINNKTELNHYYNTLEDYFTINSRIKTAQNNYLGFNMDYCYHSLFDNKDSKYIINEIYKHNGKNATLPTCNVSSTLIYSRGLNASHKNSVLINPEPSTIEQAGGRTGNRWNPDIIGNMLIHICDDPKETAIYKPLKNKNINNLWDKFYKPYLLYLKNNIKETISFYELKKLREEYDKKNKFFASIIKFNSSKSLTELKQIEFTKGTAISEKNNNSQHIKDKTDVRGNSLSRFFIVKRDDNLMSDPLNIECYRFNNATDFQELLYNTRILENVKKYFDSNDNEREKYGLKPMKFYKNNLTLFNVLIDKSKSSEYPFPILSDYSYNSEIGFYKK